MPVEQIDQHMAEQWGFIECPHCSQYHGNFVDDLALDFAAHRAAERARILAAMREPSAAMVEATAYGIILGSGGQRAADHAREFQTANWEDAKRSATAALSAAAHHMEAGDAN